MLAARSGELSYHDKAGATVAAFSETIRRYPGGYAYMLLGTGEMLDGGAGPRQYAAQGNVVVNAHIARGSDGTAHLAVDLGIRQGWHVNAHQPLQKELIPTVLTVDGDGKHWELSAVQYPKPETLRLPFQQEALALYQGNVQISGELTWNGGDGDSIEAKHTLPVRLKIQACNDQLCLLPEELILEIPASELSRASASTEI